MNRKDNRMGYPKQPTATALTRTQESWARFLLEKIDQQIEDREAFLAGNGIPRDEWDRDPVLYDLYEDGTFYERYADEMARQRAYIRSKYLGGD